MHHTLGVTPALAQVLAGYNSWMNTKVFEAAADLSDEERKRDRRAFFRSVHGTLNHILWADGVWLARFEKSERPPGSYSTELFSDFDELRELREATDRRIVEWADQLSQEWLSALLTWVSAGAKTEITRPAAICVSHFFNHQTHHRGQLTTLLTQQGVDVGVTDLPMMPGVDELYG